MKQKRDGCRAGPAARRPASRRGRSSSPSPAHNVRLEWAHPYGSVHSAFRERLERVSSLFLTCLLARRFFRAVCGPRGRTSGSPLSLLVFLLMQELCWTCVTRAISSVFILGLFPACICMFELVMFLDSFCLRWYRVPGPGGTHCKKVSPSVQPTMSYS